MEIFVANEQPRSVDESALSTLAWHALESEDLDDGVEVELVGAPEALRAVAEAAVRAAGLGDGHLSVSLVEAERMAELNAEHRGRAEPTDVLSFPVDGAGAAAGPRELGDVVICPELTADLREAVVHGVLHLCGFDHETDEGEMLELQERVMLALRS